MRFKVFLENYLIEGLGAVKRDFLNPGKIDKDDLKRIKLVGANKDLSADYTEWLAKFLVDQGFANLGRASRALFTKDVYERIRNFVRRFDDLRKKKALKGDPPHGKELDDLEDFVEHVEKKYYSKQEMKVSPRLSRGHDYERVYFDNGIEVFKVMTHAAIKEIGSGTKWCITQDDKQYWFQYTTDEAKCFFVIRNHKLNSNNPYYKLAVEVTDDDNISNVWDAEDNNDEITHDMISKAWKIPMRIFEWFDSSEWDQDQLKGEYTNFENTMNDESNRYEEEQTEWYEEKKKEYIENFKKELAEPEKYEVDEERKEKLERMIEDGLDWGDLHELLDDDGEYFDEYFNFDPMPEPEDHLKSWWEHKEVSVDSSMGDDWIEYIYALRNYITGDASEFSDLPNPYNEF